MSFPHVSSVQLSNERVGEGCHPPHPKKESGGSILSSEEGGKVEARDSSEGGGGLEK